MRDPLAPPGLTRRSITFDIVVAALFGLVAIPIHAFEGTSSVVAAILVTVALACRRIAPSTMMVCALASAAVQSIDLRIAVLPCAAYAILFYTVGDHPDRRVRFGSLAVAVAGSILAGILFPFVYGLDDGLADRAAGHLIGVLGCAVVVVGGGWATGFIRHQRHSVEQARVAETIAELERKRLLDLYAEQTERTRLARDMHDVVAHSLAVVVAQAEGARYAMATDPGAAHDALGVIADTAREALRDVRGLLEELRRDDRPVEVTATARRRLIERMRAAGMTITDLTGSPGHIAPEIADSAFRILTESLTNALKYGDLHQPVSIAEHHCDGRYTLTVRNTVAADPLAPGGAGHGIVGMTERAQRVGGTLTAAPDGALWVTELTVPERTSA
ncbi:sensor histidine kinase [Gordonia amarae]|uniref:sensor histidine kinase n=1 Tax=Gordonia amarae TaxID=36821 RepID=UPI001AF0BA69|nr:histidine kinase [Gordonia amarae]QHN16927.1 two-component sensor histidine kinase [Gordonia amarae]QHN21453.1 two-component sensor histidine kinase [Gordonia amarae]